MLAHAVSTSAPSGVTNPNPVTTTRRILLSNNKTALRIDAGEPFSKLKRRARLAGPSKSALVRVDKRDGIFHGRDLFGGIIGDFNAEFLFKRHYQFDDVEAVGTQIVDEARFNGDLVSVNAEMFDNNLFNPVGGLAHEGTLLCLGSEYSFIALMVPIGVRKSRFIRAPA
jgi:hypothetical protein